MPVRSLCLATLALGLIGAVIGCGSKPSNSVKVSGVVTLDGVALEGAKVTYYPASAEAPALGVTDGAGKFELMTFDMKGNVARTKSVLQGLIPLGQGDLASSSRSRSRERTATAPNGLAVSLKSFARVRVRATPMVTGRPATSRM